MTDTKRFPWPARRALTGWLLVALMPCLSGTALAEGLSHVTIAPAGGTVSSGTIRLHATVGEPVVGEVEAGRWRIRSGFQALFVPDVDDNDVIFADGFEAASP